MALLYVDGTYSIDGEELTQEEVTAFRDNQISLWQDELALIVVEELNISPAMQAVEFPSALIDNFATRFLRRIGEMVVAAYTFAAGGTDRVTDSGWRVAATLVDKQIEYGKGFVASLRQGTISEAQAVARARLYAGANTAAFERGKLAQLGFEAPAYPAEGCEGLVNCRCWIEVTEFPDRWEMVWHAVGDKETCGWCADNAVEYAPWVQMK